MRFLRIPWQKFVTANVSYHASTAFSNEVPGELNARSRNVHSWHHWQPRPGAIVAKTSRELSIEIVAAWL